MLEDRSCIITAVATYANGAGDDARFMMAGIEPDPIAFTLVGKRKESALERLKSREQPNILRVELGANSLKDHGEMALLDNET